MSKQRRKITSSIDEEGKEEKIISQLKNKNTTSTKDENKTVRITLDIPKPFHAQIKSYTKARGMTIKGYLLFLASQDMGQ